MKTTLTNPLTVAVVAGAIASSITGMPLPEGVARFADFLGAAAGPSALFALGLGLAQLDAAKLRDLGRVFAISAPDRPIKVLMQPLVTLARGGSICSGWSCAISGFVCAVGSWPPSRSARVSLSSRRNTINLERRDDHRDHRLAARSTLISRRWLLVLAGRRVRVRKGRLTGCHHRPGAARWQRAIRRMSAGRPGGALPTSTHPGRNCARMVAPIPGMRRAGGYRVADLPGHSLHG